MIAKTIVAETRRHVDTILAHYESMSTALARANEENKRLRMALEFYERSSDESFPNWEERMLDDGGGVANRALTYRKEPTA